MAESNLTLHLTTRMWASVDKSSMPTVHDIINTKRAIETLETELAEALNILLQTLLRVTNLQKELQERKTWISPIRKVHFDILSLIFVSCAEVDWKSPLLIGGVSRYWRAVVLATPLAWCFIDLMHDSAFKCMELYFERSRQRLLHIGLRNPDHLEYFTTKVASRIQCMGIPALPSKEDMGDLCFRHLHSLRVPMDWTLSLDVSQITTTSFPALRHLYIKNALTGTQRCPHLPPLQTLAIDIGDHRGWYDILQKCNNTLLSLEITVTQSFPTEEPRIYEIRFPRLTCLKAINENDGENPWRFNLITPSLITYIEEVGWGAHHHALHQDTNSVVYMRLSRLPTIPQSKQLRFLQLGMSFEDSCQFLDYLEANTSDYPSLEFLEFSRLYKDNSEEEALIEIVGGWDVGIRPGFKQPVVSTSLTWNMEFPGVIEDGCGDKMTCGVW